METERVKLSYPRDLADPKEWLNFVQLDPFPPAWKRLELDDDDLRALEIGIMIFPDGPPVVKGTRGLRKIRFASDRLHGGKSGAVRVYYAYFPEYGLVALIYAHDKADAETISDAQKKQISKLIEEVQKYLDGKKET